MRVSKFTLSPVSSKARRVKIEIPVRLKIVNPGQPKLTATNDIVVATVAVHETDEERAYLSARTMLKRAASESPIDSLQDLEEAITRGLNVYHDYLLTNIRLHDSDGHEYILYLYHEGDWSYTSKWLVRFLPLRPNIFNREVHVLCSGK
jgi:hypothetical protein